MNEEQMKKLAELAEKRKAKKEAEKAQSKDVLQQLKERKENTTKTFSKIRKVVSDNCNKVKGILSNSNDSAEFYSNDHAKNLDDKIRYFAQILYYPSGTGRNSLGVNTATIIFEALPSKGTMIVVKRTSIRPSPVNIILEDKIENFNEKKIEELIMDFTEEMLTRE